MATLTKQPQLIFSRQGKRRFRSEPLVALLFILPSLIGLTVFVFLPAARSILLSFTNSDMLTRQDFIGLQNYQRLVNDKQFWNSLFITTRYVILNIPSQTIIALILAVLLTRLTQSNLIRGIVFLPYLLPMVMVTMVWLTIFDYDFGPVNGFLQSLGLGKIGFFSQDNIVITLAWINTWRHAGLATLMFFAGLQTIPKELYEAARIDGANEVQSFFGITLPLLRPVTVFVVITSVVGAFQVWDSVEAIATPPGGPGGATRVIFWYITNQAFDQFNVGYAAAISVALFILMVVFALFQMRQFRGDQSDLG